MAWQATPASVGQAYLVGDPEEEDFVLVLTLSTDSPFVTPGSNLWCTFDHSFNCNHIERVKNP